MSAHERRQALRDAFLRILAMAKGAAALCICGDLYEHEHVTADTENMLVAKLAEIDCPVLLLPGNHDPYMPGSVYQRAEWPTNVHVFTTSEPERFDLTDELAIWGIAYTTRELGPEVVRNFRVPDDGRTHLLMLHGSLIDGFPEAGSDHLPVTSQELDATGADFVMLGHYHRAGIHDSVCYPGSPEPLTWGETGEHAVNVLTVDASGAHPDLHPINRLSFDSLELDVTGATSSTDVEERVRDSIADRSDAGLTLRLVLTGEIDKGCELHPDDVAERCGAGVADLVVEDDTIPAYDLDEIAREPTARGRFVAALLARAQQQPEEKQLAEQAARAGLRALEGRRDLVSLAGAESGL